MFFFPIEIAASALREHKDFHDMIKGLPQETRDRLIKSRSESISLLYRDEPKEQSNSDSPMYALAGFLFGLSF